MCKQVSTPFAKITLSVLLLFTLTAPVSGCFNEYPQRNLGGDSTTYHHDGLPQFFRSFDRPFSEKYIAAHNLQTLPASDYRTRSDIAVHLCRLGRYHEALVILKDLYRRFPKEYNIMSNLGTTYELVGKPDSALLILRKANEVYPEGHHGTEWVHLKVLEAKLAIQKDPKWLRNHQVLGMGIDKATKVYSDEHSDNGDLIAGVLYQLEERIPFTPVPDLLMANILHEVAQAIALEHSITESYIVYHIASQYDPQDVYDITQKMKHLTELFGKYKVKTIPDYGTLQHHFPPVESVLSYGGGKTYIAYHEQKDSLRALAGAADIGGGAPWYYWLGGAAACCAIGIYLFTKA